MIRSIVALLISTAAAAAQNVVPFATRDNVVELAVQNTTSLAQQHVSVEVINPPAWMSFVTSRQIIERLGGLEEKTAVFTFAVDKSAPVGVEHSLTVKVSTPSGQSWTKEIRISVAAPKEFDLFQNYPNPFNPTTAIGYQLSADSRVVLRVYDLLGREVATLVDESQTAGYYQEAWDASRYSSGIYVYELTAMSGQNTTVLRKTMLLVK